MSDDIVYRLRHIAWLDPEAVPLITEAADEIDRLRNETKSSLRQKVRDKASQRDEWRARFIACSYKLARERAVCDQLAKAYRKLTGIDGAYDPVMVAYDRHVESRYPELGDA